MKYAVAILLTCASFSLPAQNKPADMDAYVENVRKAFDVPGIAIAIVKDGKVVFSKGYGAKDNSKTSPVDTHTLFGIASNTKAFTATALSLLVEEGKVEWDAPVIQYLPWFQLSNAYVTQELTVRDLLVHRSGLGLGAGDLLWWPPSDYTRKEIARKLKFIPLATSFRTAYAYDNVLYLIAGEVIEAVSGLTWEQLVTTRIFSKAGMAESTVHFSTNGNVALPHAMIGDKVKTITPFASDNTNPAGGINSNVVDMAKWMIIQLDSGRTAAHERLFSAASARNLWTIVTPTPIRTPPPEVSGLAANFAGYALGFTIRDYKGKKIVSHTGGLPGYVSKVCLVPELKLGVVILTNQESGSAFESITYHVLDYYLGANTTDWTASFKKLNERMTAAVAAEDKQADAARASQSKPSLLLKSYAGRYSDAWYGDIVISEKDGSLLINFTHTPSLQGVLEHWQYDTFVARWNDRELRADAFVTFSLTPQGTVDQAKMEAVSASTDFSFDFQDLTLKPAAKK